MSSKCRLYRISISWNMPPTQQGTPQPSILPSPVLIVRPLKATGLALEESVLPSQSSHDPPRPLPQLTHLEMIPTTPHTKHSEPTPPILLAIFCHVPTHAGDDQESFSSIVKWELRSVPQKLHSSFDQLASKKNSASSASQVYVPSSHLSMVAHYVSISKCLIFTKQM